MQLGKTLTILLGLILPALLLPVIFIYGSKSFCYTVFFLMWLGVGLFYYISVYLGQTQ